MVSMCAIVYICKCRKIGRLWDSNACCWELENPNTCIRMSYIGIYNLCLLTFVLLYFVIHAKEIYSRKPIYKMYMLYGQEKKYMYRHKEFNVYKEKVYNIT